MLHFYIYHLTTLFLVCSKVYYFLTYNSLLWDNIIQLCIKTLQQCPVPSSHLCFSCHIYIYFLHMLQTTQFNRFYFCFKMSVIFLNNPKHQKIFTSTNIFTVSCIFHFDNPNFHLISIFFCLKQFLEDILQWVFLKQIFSAYIFFLPEKIIFSCLFWKFFFSLNIKLWVNMFTNKI